MNLSVLRMMASSYQYYIYTQIFNIQITRSIQKQILSVSLYTGLFHLSNINGIHQKTVVPLPKSYSRVLRLFMLLDAL